MKQQYEIEVDCANCADKMERAANKVSGVRKAWVNFIQQTMLVEFEKGEDPQTVMRGVLKACRRVEPDCEIVL